MGIAALMSIAALASAASGFLLENLPENPGRTGTGRSIGSGLFETVGGTAIECTTGTGTGVEVSSKPPSGTSHGIAMGCVSKKPVNGLKCTGTGDSSGTILGSGTWQLVFDKNPANTALVTATVLLIAPQKFECGAGIVMVEVKGSVVCLNLNPTASTKSHEGHCVQTKGAQEETRWWDTNGTEHAAQLLASINGAGFEQAAQQGLGVVESAEAIQADQ
jgi:hypothetical protein